MRADPSVRKCEVLNPLRTAVFLPARTYNPSRKSTSKNAEKITRAFAKIVCFAGDSHRQEFEISGFARSRLAWEGFYVLGLALRG